MAGQNEPHMMSCKSGQRPARPACERVRGQGMTLDLRQQQRMMHDGDAHKVPGQGIEPRKHALKLPLADASDGAIEIVRQPLRRLHADDANLSVRPERLEFLCDEAAVTLVGPQQPLDRVPLRQIMIARHGKGWRRQPIQECPCCDELLRTRRLREITRDDDEIRARVLERPQQPIDGRRVDAPEMQV
jgi:hypothetical protein